MNHKTGLSNGGVDEVRGVTSNQEIAEAEKAARKNIEIMEENGMKINKELLEEKITRFKEVENIIGMNELLRRTILCRNASERIQHAKEEELVSKEVLHKLKNQLQTAIDRYQIFPPDFYFGPEAEKMITGISETLDRLSAKEN